MKYKKNWIKKGMEVASVHNIEQMMVVEDLLYIEREIDYGGEEGKRTVKRFDGIICHWYFYLDTDEEEKNKQFKKSKFHSRELVPWEIAVQGEKEINLFMFDQQNKS